MNDIVARQNVTESSHFRTEIIPFENIPGQTKLFVDYQSDASSLRRYFPNAVNSISALPGQADAVLSGYVTDRDVLCDALLEVNGSFDAGYNTLTNIERLRDTRAVAAVTGQQAGLFSGSLYSIYKAMSAIKAAERLSELGTPCVPVFWIATEDHDFEEVSKANAVGGNGNLITATAKRSSQFEGLPVGSISLGNEITEVVDGFISELPSTEFSDRLRDLLEHTWPTDAYFGNAFGAMLAELFDPWGLILVDPMHPTLKRLAASIYKKAVENADEVAGALIERTDQLVKDGYHVQVLVEDDHLPLFWHTDEGVRSALRKSGDGLYRSKESGDEFSSADLIAAIESDPGRFSPGVMLRSVVQDHLFPTICYFGGGAEIAYFAQNSEVYRLLGRRPTAILHRQSFTVVEAKQSRALEALDLSFVDLFSGIEEILPRIADKHLSPASAGIFADVEDKINIQLNRLDQELSGIDKTLAESLAKRRKKIIYHVGTIRNKAFRAALRNNETAERRINSLFANLLPGGHLQERTLNISSYFNKYGPYFINWIHDAIDADERGHVVIYL